MAIVKSNYSQDKILVLDINHFSPYHLMETSYANEAKEIIHLLGAYGNQEIGKLIERK